MKIKLKPDFASQTDFVNAFKPDKDGIVTIENIAKNYAVTEEKALEMLPSLSTFLEVIEQPKNATNSK